MLYTAYELGYAAISPARIAAGIGARMWRSPFNPIADSWLARTAAASLDMFEHVQAVSPLFAEYVRAQKGGAFLGRLDSEMTADERRRRRMQAAGDA